MIVELPKEHLPLIGLLVWYFLLGLTLRILGYSIEKSDDVGGIFVGFLFSPILLVGLVILIVATTAAWIISCGLFPPPWRMNGTPSRQTHT